MSDDADAAACAAGLVAPSPDVRTAHARLQRAIDAREVPLLLAVVSQLRARSAPDHALDLATRALALVPTPDAAATCVELLREPGMLAPRSNGHPDGRSRSIGALLASTHDDATLGAVLERSGGDASLRELFACWVHERVLRGGALADEPAVQRFQGDLVAHRHPFRALPLERTAFERGVERFASQYSLLSSGGWWWDRPALEPEPMTRVERRSAQSIVDVTGPDDARIAAVWQSASAVSNGRSEARVFELDPPFRTEFAPDGSDLRELPLECLRGAADLELAELPPERAFSALLSFATQGGDYNRDWSAAHGRLAAWRSLARMVDARRDAPLGHIEDLARRCRFTMFVAGGPWFYRVATDFGLAVLRPDGASLAVFAGTDTD